MCSVFEKYLCGPIAICFVRLVKHSFSKVAKALFVEMHLPEKSS